MDSKKLIGITVLLVAVVLLSGCGDKPQIHASSTELIPKKIVAGAVVKAFNDSGVTLPSMDMGYDANYCLPTHDSMVDALVWISFEIIPQLNFEEKGYAEEVRDCDNFAFLVASILPFMTVPDYPSGGLPIAVISLHMPTPHAVVGWMDDEGFWLAEPQASRQPKIFSATELPEAKTIYRVNFM